MRGAGMDLQDIFVVFYPFRLPAIALAQARRAGKKGKKTIRLSAEGVLPLMLFGFPGWLGVL